jgi:hypothetical protein
VRDADALYAFGRLSAIGFSAFGIDDQGNAPLDLVGITNPSEHLDNNAIGYMYSDLSRLAPMILEKQETGGLIAAVIEGEAQRLARRSIGDYTATFNRAGGATSSGTRIGVMFLQTTDKPGPPIVGIESVDEEFFENGAWMPRRRLNGDESSQGQALRLYATDLGQGKNLQSSALPLPIGQQMRF